MGGARRRSQGRPGPVKWLALHIGGQRWSVFLVSPKSKHLVNDAGDRLGGKCEYDACRIYIDRTLSESSREDTLWHELLHALLFVTGAERAYGGDYDVDEAIVSALTPAMHRLLRDLGFRFPRGPYL